MHHRLNVENICSFRTERDESFNIIRSISNITQEFNKKFLFSPWWIFKDFFSHFSHHLTFTFSRCLTFIFFVYKLINLKIILFLRLLFTVLWPFRKYFLDFFFHIKITSCLSTESNFFKDFHFFDKSQHAWHLHKIEFFLNFNMNVTELYHSSRWTLFKSHFFYQRKLHHDKVSFQIVFFSVEKHFSLKPLEKFSLASMNIEEWIKFAWGCLFWCNFIISFCLLFELFRKNVIKPLFSSLCEKNLWNLNFSHE